MAVISVREAAARLGVNTQRIRQLVGAGAIDAERVGGRWLIDEDVLERYAALPRAPGRPYAPRRAWGLLALAGGRDPVWLPEGERAALAEILAGRSLRELVGRLGNRADMHRWYVHPSMIADLLAEASVVRGGAEASGRLEDRGVAEAYVDPRSLDRLRGDYFPEEDPYETNVIVRVVKGPWPFASGEQVAWPVVAAVDLLERGDDPRVRHVAEELLAATAP